MHLTKTTIRRLACTAGLVLAALAVFAGGAAAGSGASGIKAQKFNPGVTDFPSVSSGAVSQEKFVPGVSDFPSAVGQTASRGCRSTSKPTRVDSTGVLRRPARSQPRSCFSVRRWRSGLRSAGRSPSDEGFSTLRSPL